MKTNSAVKALLGYFDVISRDSALRWGGLDWESRYVNMVQLTTISDCLHRVEKAELEEKIEELRAEVSLLEGEAVTYKNVMDHAFLEPEEKGEE